MQRNRGFAPVVGIIVLVVLAMLIAQCDVSYAVAPTAGPTYARIGGMP